MPGLTSTAVVLLWVLLGVGACGSVYLPVSGYFTTAWADDGLEPGLGAVIAVSSAVLLVLTVARGLFAVRIRRRSARARTGAIAAESVGLAVALASWFVAGALAPVTSTTDTGAGLETTTSYGPNVVAIAYTCPGIILSILVIVFLSTAPSRSWCDR
ncbi:hypothetical protein GCM10009853_016400 [Glycomyces scopariae]